MCTHKCKELDRVGGCEVRVLMVWEKKLLLGLLVLAMWLQPPEQSVLYGILDDLCCSCPAWCMKESYDSFSRPQQPLQRFVVLSTAVPVPGGDISSEDAL